LNVDRIEIASARVKGEFQGVKGIMAWAQEKDIQIVLKY
jgi:D-citramalate synthase